LLVIQVIDLPGTGNQLLELLNLFTDILNFYIH